MSSELPDPASAPELFEGILTRRVIAYVLDVIIMMVVVGAILVVGLVMGLFSGGALLLVLPFAIPLAIVAYYAITLGSPKRATVGMNMMDIVLTPTRAAPLDGWKAFMHPLIFWLTCWILPPFNYFVALFTPRRQMIHDFLTGTLMVRRSPMVRHWDRYP